MDSADKRPKGLSISDLAKPMWSSVEFAGEPIQVCPISLGTMKELDQLRQAGTSADEVGRQGLLRVLKVGGTLLNEGQLAALDSPSLQTLAKEALSRSGFDAPAGDAVSEFGIRASDLKRLYSPFPESATKLLSDSAAAQLKANLEGLNLASAQMKELTARWSPGLSETLKAIDGITSQIPEVAREKREFDSLPFIDPAVLPANRAAKAAEETAKQTREMLVAMSQMTQELSALSSTMIGTVVPQWVAHMRNAEDEAKQTATRAESSLKWAAIAVWVSIVSTVGTAGWDWLNSAKSGVEFEIRADSFESMMRHQIQGQTKLLEEIARLRSVQFDQLSAIQAQMQKSAELQAQLQVRLEQLAVPKEAPKPPVQQRSN